MAFVAATPDAPVTSDVVAGGTGAAVDVPAATATPTPPPVPTATVAAPVDAAPGSDEQVADTDLGAPGAPGVIVPDDFVPVFVADDLTATGAHTSATPEPAPAQSAPPEPTATAPTPPPPTPTPAPAPPEPTPPPVEPTPTAPAPATTDSAAANSSDDDEPGAAPSPADWAALRECESGGNYGINSGNGYFGAYQFSQATWDWVASLTRPRLVGVRPSDAAPADQDALAYALYDMRGAAPWPSCGVHLR